MTHGWSEVSTSRWVSNVNLPLSSNCMLLVNVLYYLLYFGALNYQRILTNRARHIECLEISFNNLISRGMEFFDLSSWWFKYIINI